MDIPVVLLHYLALIRAISGKVKCVTLKDLSSVSRLDCFHENIKSVFIMGLAIWLPKRRMRTVGVGEFMTLSRFSLRDSQFCEPSFKQRNDGTFTYLQRR